MKGEKMEIRVKVNDLGSAFHGHVGTIVSREDDARTIMYRVWFDTPVDVPNYGSVANDLWAGDLLQLLSEEEEEENEDEDN
jgi:hypothetical protein